MKNTVRIVTVLNRDCDIEKATTQNYKCQYEIGGRVRMIDTFGEYREISSNELARTNAEGQRVGHEAGYIQLAKTKMYVEYKYNDNEKDEDFSAADKNTKKIVELFWGKNPLCLKNGKPHTLGQSGDHYDMIDSNLKTINAVASFKDKLRASNAISEMDHAQRTNVAFYYGRSPVGKSEEELLVDLGDGDDGYCLQDENIHDFLKVWVDGKSSDRDLLVTLKKAIGGEFITNKMTDGRNAYYLGETFLGSDDVGLIDWSRKNPQVFQEHIVRKVSAEDKKESAVVKSIATNATTKVELGILEGLRKQAKELVEEGFISSEANSDKMGYEKLKKTVDAALLKKNSVEI